MTIENPEYHPVIDNTDIENSEVVDHSFKAGDRIWVINREGVKFYNELSIDLRELNTSIQLFEIVMIYGPGEEENKGRYVKKAYGRFPHAEIVHVQGHLIDAWDIGLIDDEEYIVLKATYDSES